MSGQQRNLGRWSPEEDAILVRLIATDMMWTDIAAQLRRTPPTCNARMHILKISRPAHVRGNFRGASSISAEEAARRAEIILRLCREGLSGIAIHQQTGISVPWVFAEIARLRAAGTIPRRRHRAVFDVSAGHRHNSNPSADWRARKAERDATVQKIIQHAVRMEFVADDSEAEMQAAIAAALAAGRVTQCPTRAVAAINNGDGLEMRA